MPEDTFPITLLDMPWMLHVRSADSTTAVYSLPETGAVIVGREMGEIRIPHDVSVSGQHVRLTIKKHEILYDDLHSTNGVLHRNIRKASGVALDGDELVLGQSTLRFELQQLKAEGLQKRKGSTP